MVDIVVARVTGVRCSRFQECWGGGNVGIGRELIGSPERKIEENEKKKSKLSTRSSKYPISKKCEPWIESNKRWESPPPINWKKKREDH